MLNNQFVNKGDLWWVDLPKGKDNDSIQYGRRPCYVWSNDKNNKFAPTINVLPMTSQLRKVYPMHVLVGIEYGLDKPSYTLPEQIRTISKDNLISKIGECDDLMIKRIEDGVDIQRGLQRIHENDLNSNLQFDEQRAFKMALSINKMENLITHQKSQNIINMLAENLNTQIHFLKAYCNDFNENINKYYQGINVLGGGVIQSVKQSV